LTFTTLGFGFTQTILVSAPIVEELAKALGVLLIFWLLRPESDNMRDGIVYGALVGLGFSPFLTPPRRSGEPISSR
jgi:RsiW-degrading membrane proteinase PrsW (M82 family)